MTVPQQPPVSDGSVLLAAVVDMAPGYAEQGRTYEDAVLGLLGRHDGVLERRLWARDGGTEVHVIRFGSRAAYQGFLADPQRQRLRVALGDAAPAARAFEVEDAP